MEGILLKSCQIDDCQRRYYAKGLCEMHYQRLKNTGTTDPGPRAEGTLQERLLRNSVALSDTGCIEWMGFVTNGGYGRIQQAGKGSPHVSTHRAAYELENGPIPAGKIVMHSCDNRRCVNPEHLSLGSHSDNTKDMVAKGRHGSVKGGDYSRKLSENDVREIRASSLSCVKMARDLGVSVTTVRSARVGITWSHVK